MQIYKHATTKLRRGTEFLWVPLDDLACKCPKIRVEHTYLILGNKKLKQIMLSINFYYYCTKITFASLETGNDERDSQPSGLIADRRSVVIDWKEEWDNRMMRFQRRQSSGKCKTTD
jgi:netrin receptor unc-5